MHNIRIRMDAVLPAKETVRVSRPLHARCESRRVFRFSGLLPKTRRCNSCWSTITRCLPFALRTR